MRHQGKLAQRIYRCNFHETFLIFRINNTFNFYFWGAPCLRGARGSCSLDKAVLHIRSRTYRYLTDQFFNFFQIQFFNRFFNFYFLLYELLTYFNGNVLLFLKPILVLKRGLTWTRAKSWNFALSYRKSGGLIITYKNSLLKQKYAVIEGTVERFIAKYFQSLYKRQCVFEVFPLSFTFSMFNETNSWKVFVILISRCDRMIIYGKAKCCFF